MINEKWVVKDRTIFVAEVKNARSDFGVDYKKQDAIAFNVKQKIAEHIVKLHNAAIDSQ